MKKLMLSLLVGGFMLTSSGQSFAAVKWCDADQVGKVKITIATTIKEKVLLYGERGEYLGCKEKVVSVLYAPLRGCYFLVPNNVE